MALQKKITSGSMPLRSETGIVLVLVLVLLTVISLITSHNMTHMILTTKTGGSLKMQLLDSIEAENQLVRAELAIQKNPEKYQDQEIGFVPDHLELGCTEGVSLYKVSVPPLESFIAVRKPENSMVSMHEEFWPLKVVVDLNQRGTGDKVYTADEDHLWSTNFTLDVKFVKNLRVVPDPTGQGVRLYFLGQYRTKKGVFMVRDYLNTVITCIIEGDFRALFVRFGRLIAIPTDPNREPSMLDLPSHQQVPIKWNTKVLNNGSQLSSLVERIHEDKIGRIAWRKAKN